MINLLAEICDLLEHSHRYENYVTGLCPFHKDNRPSFFVYIDGYYCKSCGARGTTQKLYAHLTHSSIPTKVSTSTNHNFTNPFSLWLKSQSLEQTLITAAKILKSTPSSYMTNRGIPPETQIQFGLGIRENWITFPIYDKNDVLVGAVARAGEGNPSESKYVVPNGQSPDLLYVPSWQLIKQAKFIYTTFGIIDALTFAMLGYAAMSTIAGKRNSSSAFKDIRKKMVVIPDYGEEVDGLKLAANLSWRGQCKQILWPINCKDVNDVYRKEGKQMMHYFEVAYG